jgi:hypothetical protein
MTVKAPFQPRYGQGQTMTSAAASAAVTIDAQAKSVQVTNTGANPAYFRISNSAAAAVAADCIILAGTQVTVSKGDGDNSFAHISPLGTTLNVITGEGF